VQAEPEPTIRAADYADKWLVILSSSRERGITPPGAEGLEGLIRLDSSLFKGLMPCFEIVIAGAYDDRTEAVARTKALSDEDIDSYAKQSGAYVGDDPRLADYCSAPPTACTGDYRFVETYGETPFMHLALDDLATERATEDAPEAKRMGEALVWRTDLSAQRIEDWAIGQKIGGWSADGASQACTIRGFAALTRGTPHFGWYDGDQKTPGCGRPEVFATLDCDGPVHLAAPADGPVLKISPVSTEKPSPQATGFGTEVLQRDPTYQSLHTQARQQANDRGEDLQEEILVREITHQKHVYLLITAHLTTADGNDRCGGEDVNIVVAGVARGPDETRRGENVVPFHEAGEDEIQALIDDGTRSISVLKRSWPQRHAVTTRKGTEICAVDIDYCDCDC